jgi:HSP20 family protein
MSLTLWKKRAPLASTSATGDLVRLRDEMDRTFERFFSEPFGLFGVEPKALRSNGWIPPLDVSETDTEMTIRAEVPGIATKDLDISVSGTMLTIAGQKDETTEKQNENFCQCERRFGSFRRLVELPETVDTDKVTAESDNGVVTIRIGKKPGAKPRQVEVKPASKKVSIAA